MNTPSQTPDKLREIVEKHCADKNNGNELTNMKAACLEWAAVENKELKDIIDINVTPKEKCVVCNQLWNPSLVESSHCIFCICNGYKSQVKLMEVEFEQLGKRLTSANQRADDEKNRRIYYQDIVYRLLTELDNLVGRYVRTGTGLLAGSFEQPSNDWKVGINELKSKLDEQIQRADEAEKLVNMPGAWECEHCGFVLTKSVITPKGVFANNEPFAEVCPNDGKYMKPLTWKKANIGYNEKLEELFTARDSLKLQLSQAVKLAEELERLTEHKHTGLIKYVDASKCPACQAITKLEEFKKGL